MSIILKDSYSKEEIPNLVASCFEACEIPIEVGDSADAVDFVAGMNDAKTRRKFLETELLENLEDQVSGKIEYKEVI